VSRRTRPPLRDIRRVYRLLGECFEQRHDSVAWRSHLLSGIQDLVGARIALYVHVDAPLSAKENVTEALSVGFLDTREQALWAHYQATQAQRDDPFHLAFYRQARATPGVLARRLDAVLARKDWQRSRHCGDYIEACRLSDRIASSLTLPGSGAQSEQTLVLHRDAGDGAFPDSAVYLVRLLHHELAALQRDRLTLPGSESDLARLPPRLRDVLAGLLAGESEKEIAGRLGLSAHTVNRHVQRLYQRYDVSCRSRLLAKLYGGPQQSPSAQ
jgi:ATP/maltotriose-dependent transcriptional regulator MalT